MEEHKELATEYIEQDPKGFFLVKLDREKREIIVDHFSNDNILLNRITGGTARYICKKAIALGLVSDSSHAAYLGHELRNAQIALEQGIEYQQDRDITFPKAQVAEPANGSVVAESGSSTYFKAGRLVPIAGNPREENVKVGGIEMNWREFLRSRGLSRAF